MTRRRPAWRSSLIQSTILQGRYHHPRTIASFRIGSLEQKTKCYFFGQVLWRWIWIPTRPASQEYAEGYPERIPRPFQRHPETIVGGGVESFGHYTGQAKLSPQFKRSYWSAIESWMGALRSSWARTTHTSLQVGTSQCMTSQLANISTGDQSTTSHQANRDVVGSLVTNLIWFRRFLRSTKTSRSNAYALTMLRLMSLYTLQFLAFVATSMY